MRFFSRWTVIALPVKQCPVTFFHVSFSTNQATHTHTRSRLLPTGKAFSSITLPVSPLKNQTNPLAAAPRLKSIFHHPKIENVSKLGHTHTHGARAPAASHQVALGSKRAGGKGLRRQSGRRWAGLFLWRENCTKLQAFRQSFF
jgi:hypothetical protein